MASGTLLVLVGEACKQKETYLALDKEYIFEVLFTVRSDTGDVLGLIDSDTSTNNSKLDLELSSHQLKKVCETLVGEIELPYPKFSSKTVQGKPLHTWTLEGRLHEITIPTKTSTIHVLQSIGVRTISIDELYKNVSEKIETIKTVTDPKKALGNDFRRPEVRDSWKTLYKARPQETYQIATFRCVCSSGTYMRTLAEVIARELCTTGLAYSIHRTRIGIYHPLPLGLGFWYPSYR